MFRSISTTPLREPNFTRKRQPNCNANIEKRDYKVPAFLRSLGIPLEALLAIPKLLVCDVAITPVFIRALYNVTAAT
jgi:hypothetical protein